MDVEELKKITEICKIKLEKEEYEEFVKELEEIISYFSKIEEIEVGNEELHYVNEIYNPLRDDESEEGKKEKSEAIIREFTKKDGRSLLAPKIKM
jgi:aspartyl/glutamyl-tRNA(Asn/Gln) amidotransferase C subunit